MTQRKKLSINNLSTDIVDKIKAEQLVMAKNMQKVEVKQTSQQKHEQEATKLKKQQFNAAWKFLQDRFPKVFNPDNPLPLKLNIHIDIFDDKSVKTKLELGDFNKTAIRGCLTKFCRSKKYHKTIINSEQRYDLQGNPVAQIEQQHKDDSKIFLDSYKK